MEQEQEINKILSEIKESITTKTREEVSHSILDVEVILKRFYSKDSPYIEKLISIKTIVSNMISQKLDVSLYYKINLIQLKDMFDHLLESIIKEVSRLGIPSSNDTMIDQSINFNVSQNQNQEQFQTIQFSIFLEFIKDDITGKQLKELQEIAKSEGNPEIAKPEIIKKLKSFGENVCANIVSSILTNPTIWNSMVQ